MAHVARYLIAFSAATLAMAACGQAEAPDDSSSEASRASLIKSLASVPLYETTQCSTDPLGAPKAGDMLDWRLLKGTGDLDMSSLRRQRIKAVTGDTVDYDEILEMSAHGAFPAEARAVRFGILPTRLMEASVRYDGASEAIAGLTPGMTVSIPFHLSRAGSTLSAVAQVTLVNCGVSTAAITGAPGEAVVVYRLVMPYSTTLEPNALSQTIDSEYVVSRARGWPIADTTASGTFVLVPRTG